MEIPYIVEPRKDTGLNNSKIGIWLFLASEVMLFGGLFSGYIFLRIYADYPWPERTLPVLPGLINTFVLIGSSITVVFAWVSLKLRQWRKFQIYMAITIICAALFMVLKGVEYNAKFHHQAIRLDDYTVIEGHAHAQGDSHDAHAPKKNLNFTAKSIQIDVRRVDDAYYEALAEQYENNTSIVTLTEDVEVEDKVLKSTKTLNKGTLITGHEVELYKLEDSKFETTKFILADNVTLSNGDVLEKGTPISKALIDTAKEDFLTAVANNSSIDIDLGRQAWKDMKAKYPGVKYYEKAEGDKTLNEVTSAYLKGLKEKRKKDYLAATAALTFVPSSGSALITIDPYWGKLSHAKEGAKGNLRLKDQTVIFGITADSSITLAVDGIDFRHTVMKADEKGIDPVAAVANSWLLKDEGMHAIWEKHKVVTAKLAEVLKDKDREPSENDVYRINWQEIVAFQRIEKEGLKVEDLSHEEIMAYFPGDLEGFAGPSHKTVHYPEITVPREQVRFESVFSPRWNTYYATYFTITGLHGLHVIAGALVLGYYLFFGRKMYNENPEWLANRVEVGGLFWHFVDLVWIFLFPILYLM